MNQRNEHLYIKLYRELKEQIINGFLTKDSKLLSIREYSKKSNLSTTTIEKAYWQLQVEGYITSVPKSGYYVLDVGEISSLSETDRLSPIIPQSYSNNALSTELFDLKIYKSIINKVLNYSHDKLYTECSPSGEIELREEIRKYVLKERDVITDVNQIIIGPGIQSLLNILVSLKDYEKVTYLTPGFDKAIKVFSSKGYQTFPLNTVSGIIQRPADYLYISPSNIYPSGEVLKIQDRVKLINWAQENSSYIIEDDYNFFIRYNASNVPSIHSLDPSHVIYIGSFSKSLLPSMRISFMILPITLYNLYIKSYQSFSQGISKLEQLSLAQFMRDGYFARHTKKLYNAYKEKNEILQESFLPYISKGILTLSGTDSNLHVLIDFNDEKALHKFSNQCQKKGFKYTIIVNTNTIIFPYSGISNEQMNSTIKSLLK